MLLKILNGIFALLATTLAVSLNIGFAIVLVRLLSYTPF